MSNEIGLAELIAQVKEELAVKLDDSPVFWVEKVELELNVTVQKEGGSVIKIGIFSIGEASVNGQLSSEDVHKIKLTLKSLYTDEDYRKDEESLPKDERDKKKIKRQESTIKGQNSNITDPLPPKNK